MADSAITKTSVPEHTDIVKQTPDDKGTLVLSPDRNWCETSHWYMMAQPDSWVKLGEWA